MSERIELNIISSFTQERAKEKLKEKKKRKNIRLGYAKYSTPRPYDPIVENWA